MRNRNTGHITIYHFLIFLLIAVLLSNGLLISYVLQKLDAPDSYFECTQKGGVKTLISGVQSCTTKTGNFFVDPISAPTIIPYKPTDIPTPIPTTPRKEPKDGCIIGGCSNHLCLDIKQKDVQTTCEIKPFYVCYRHATCERQSNGRCGWTNETLLTSCLDAYGEKNEN